MAYFGPCVEGTILSIECPLSLGDCHFRRDFRGIFVFLWISTEDVECDRDPAICHAQYIMQ